MLTDELIMMPGEAERCIINLIRNSRLDFKIDYKSVMWLCVNNTVSPCRQVIEKNKSLSFRSQMLVMNFEKKLNKNRRLETPNWAIQDFVFY